MAPKTKQKKLECRPATASNKQRESYRKNETRKSKTNSFSHVGKYPECSSTKLQRVSYKENQNREEKIKTR